MLLSVDSEEITQVSHEESWLIPFRGCEYLQLHDENFTMSNKLVVLSCIVLNLELLEWPIVEVVRNSPDVICLQVHHGSLEHLSKSTSNEGRNHVSARHARNSHSQWGLGLGKCFEETYSMSAYCYAKLISRGIFVCFITLGHATLILNWCQFFHNRYISNFPFDPGSSFLFAYIGMETNMAYLIRHQDAILATREADFVGTQTVEQLPRQNVLTAIPIVSEVCDYKIIASVLRNQLKHFAVVGTKVILSVLNPAIRVDKDIKLEVLVFGVVNNLIEALNLIAITAPRVVIFLFKEYAVCLCKSVGHATKFFTLFTITFASTEEATALLKWKSIFKNHNNSLLASWQPSSDACSGCVNNLSCTIPPEMGNLTNLIYLDLNSNQISGTIPSQIGSLVKLQILRIFDNHLNGPIPGEIDLYVTQLSGPIPGELGKLKNLNDLELSNNQHTGSIPSSFGNLTNLQTLFLGNNNLTDKIPSSFCNLMSLTLLYLLKNNLKGKFLECLGNISGLQYVIMSHNNLSEELPSSICNLTSLQVLDLGRNNLMGAIPQCFGNMSRHLEVLDLQQNNLSGTLPTTFCNGSALKSFNLHGNKLEGKIPRSLKYCKELQVVDLGDNLLNDTFPMWLGTLPELRVLSLKSNKLHGPIRTSGSEYMFLELQILDLSCNDFSKNLLMSLFQHLKAMRTIDKKTNASSYELHQHYQDLVDVVTKGLELEVVRILSLYTTIDLSNNKFEGHIPCILGDLIALRALNLSHNGLQGHIPPSFGNLSLVESLDLSFNQLSGEIPEQIASLTTLEFFNLSHNNLEGCIPRGLNLLHLRTIHTKIMMDYVDSHFQKVVVMIQYQRQITPHLC
ncbi:hypothetical protein T459_31585 [Capsicum annuum]|uniref:Leucine-rich repeat-containing N-terminal plant-type domain-containing protein n=1 Tax=Capsicum annuum TaxID=4072 RepID=A0A2G2YBQ4_CAPAN|nr:hypothetical protein T459_31585 [Capsicum annuum]